MTEFEKSVYTDMKSVDRVLLWAIKAIELMEFSDLLTKEDILLVRDLVKMEKKKKKKGGKRNENIPRNE